MEKTMKHEMEAGMNKAVTYYNILLYIIMYYSILQ